MNHSGITTENFINILVAFRLSTARRHCWTLELEASTLTVPESRLITLETNN
jgi:hypothetical protein